MKNPVRDIGAWAFDKIEKAMNGRGFPDPDKENDLPAPKPDIKEDISVTEEENPFIDKKSNN